MPYPNEHACRLRQPIAGAPTRRANGEREHDGKKYDVIYQQQQGKWIEQAYRYPKGIWTAAAARTHCKGHSGILFEPAAGGQNLAGACCGGGRGFSITCKADEAEIVLYDVLDPWFGISARTIHQRLKDAGDIKRIRVRINSPGGSIFEGGAIHNLLATHPARVVVTIDGLAASMASVVAMAGDEIEMGEGAYLMIHDPTAFVRGDAGDMREMAELLDKMKGQLTGIYARRTRQTEAQIAQWMAEETWMTAGEAIERRFADRAVAGLKMAASIFDLSQTFRRVPEDLFTPEEDHLMSDTQTIQSAPGPATLKELRALCPGADEKFLCAQLDAEATPEQAGKAWTAEQNRRLEAANQKAAAAEAKLAEAEKKAIAGKSGVEPLGSGSKGPSGETAGDAMEAWEKLIAGYVAQGIKRPKAIARAVREHPEAHAAYVAAYNSKHGHPAGRFA